MFGVVYVMVRDVETEEHIVKYDFSIFYNKKKVDECCDMCASLRLSVNKI